MNFTNTSNKVIGIGGKYVMPGQTAEISTEDAQLPAVRIYVDMGLASVEGGPDVEDSPAASDISVAEDGPAASDTPAPGSKAENFGDAVVSEELPDLDTKPQKERKGRAATKK